MQQIPFVDLFKSALHVSGDKLAHPHEQQYRCIVPKLYIQSKTAHEDGRVCLPKHVELI